MMHAKVLGCVGVTMVHVASRVASSTLFIGIGFVIGILIERRRRPGVLPTLRQVPNTSELGPAPVELPQVASVELQRKVEAELRSFAVRILQLILRRDAHDVSGMMSPPRLRRGMMH